MKNGGGGEKATHQMCIAEKSGFKFALRVCTETQCCDAAIAVRVKCR